MAAQARPMADGPDLAAIAVRSLARPARPLAAACTRVADAGGAGWLGLARTDAFPRGGLTPARSAAAADALELLRAKLPHLRSAWRPARDLVLQPRRLESIRGRGRAANVPAAIPLGADRVQPRRVFSGAERGFRILPCALSSRRRCGAGSLGNARTLSGRAVLPLRRRR